MTSIYIGCPALGSWYLISIHMRHGKSKIKSNHFVCSHYSRNYRQFKLLMEASTKHRLILLQLFLQAWLSDLSYHLLFCFIRKALMSLPVMIERCHICTGLWPCPGNPAIFLLLVLKLFYTYCKVHWCTVLLKSHTLSDIWLHTIQWFRCMVLKEVSYISAVKWCSNMNVSKSLLKLGPYHIQKGRDLAVKVWKMGNDPTGN